MAHSPATNLIVTGLPRSGVALASALIDGLPDSFCFNSPPWHAHIVRKLGAPLPMCKWLVGEFAWQRKQLLSNAHVLDYRAKDTAPLTDLLLDPRRVINEDGVMMTVETSRPGLSQNVLLGMSHASLYTAILPQLAAFDHFKIIAIIRNPVDVILAWQKWPETFIAKGNPPHLARLWPEAAAIIESAASPLDQMAQIYELFCARYAALEEKIQIVKYEDLTADPSLLSKALGKTLPPSLPALSAPPRQRDMKDADAIRGAMAKYGAFAKQFYPNL